MGSGASVSEEKREYVNDISPTLSPLEGSHYDNAIRIELTKHLLRDTLGPREYREVSEEPNSVRNVRNRDEADKKSKYHF